MKKKWTALINELVTKGIEIVSSTERNVRIPYVQIKGELQSVDYATEKILALQSDVKERRIPISHPRIYQYLFNDPDGQMLLNAVEVEASVCIEVSFNGGSSAEQLPLGSSAIPPAPPDGRACTFSLPHGLKFEILKGDISYDDSDVIVNTTEEDLDFFGSGVSAALLQRGGQELEDTCIEAVLAGHRATDGNVVETRATGQLKCRSIFHISLQHTITPCKTILACLELAEKRNYQSIAFPAIGTGGYGISPSRIALDIFNALKTFTKGEPPIHIKVIRLVVFLQDMYNQFMSDFKSMAESNVMSYNIGSSMKRGQSGDVNNDDFPEFVTALSSNSPNLKANIIFHIFGETEQAVKTAETRLRFIIDTQIPNEKIDNVTFHSQDATLNKKPKIFGQVHGSLESVSQAATVIQRAYRKHLSDSEFSHLQQSSTHQEKWLQLRHHKTSTDKNNDWIFHTVKTQNDSSHCQEVMQVKDEIDCVEQLSQRTAADILFKTVRWIRMISLEKVEDYGEDLNYEIEQAYQSNKIVFDSSDNQFVINFATMEEIHKFTNKTTATVRRADLTKVESRLKYCDLT